jgi:hypothetical protein
VAPAFDLFFSADQHLTLPVWVADIGIIAARKNFRAKRIERRRP